MIDLDAIEKRTQMFRAKEGVNWVKLDDAEALIAELRLARDVVEADHALDKRRNERDEAKKRWGDSVTWDNHEGDDLLFSQMVSARNRVTEALVDRDVALARYDEGVK